MRKFNKVENFNTKLFDIDKKFLITISVILMIIFLSIIYFTKEYVNPNIHKGVKIENIDVSNLSKKEALSKVKKETDVIINNKNIDFYVGEENFCIPLKNFGYNLDLNKAVNEAYSYGRGDNLFSNYFKIIKSSIVKKNIIADTNIDISKRDKVVEGLSEKIYKRPVDAKIIINEDKTVTVKKSEIGRYLDLDETKKLINLDMFKEEKIELPVYDSNPNITSSYYNGIDKLLGDFETDYSGSIKNRKDNIKLAASKFNNLKLSPGDEISFNDVVGEITAENGFKSATVIVGGEYESGIGGGICQVSTTLYNSLILSDLEIIERHNHSRPISYVDLGTDAAVASGYKDLKFKNNTNNPIVILSQANGEKLDFKVLGNGKDRDYEVKIIPELLETIIPDVNTIYSDDISDGESIVKQSGSKGYSYKTYKEILKDGKVIDKRQISKSYYVPKDKIVVVGTGNESDENDED